MSNTEVLYGESKGAIFKTTMNLGHVWGGNVYYILYEIGVAV
jgi:hypothetical protein